MSNLKRCSGYKKHWECAEDYPDHMVPRSMFISDKSSKDGLDHKCRKCKGYYNSVKDAVKPRHPETNQRKIHWLTSIAKEYYGGMPSDPKSDARWKQCRAKANKDAESIAWVIPNAGKPDNVVALTPKENFGPRTPMTRRKSTEVTGNKVPEGWVYIVRNPEVPKYLKIGKTFPNGIGAIMADARRFGRAELVFKSKAAYAEYAEKKIAHVELSEYNLRSRGYTDVGTEVFEVPLKKAIEVVKMACDIVNDPEWEGVTDLGDANES